MSISNKNEIILYQTSDLSIKLDVRVEDDTVWLTQAQIVTLFDSSKANISEHIKHILETNELEESTVRKIRTVRQEGGRTISRDLVHYNLDMILSIGYIVNSIHGTQFRIWAEDILKKNSTEVAGIQPINNKIFIVRGVAVMLDRHIAEFYQTETRILKQAVKRNIERFPDDFMFELNNEDIQSLVSQSVIPNSISFGGAKPFVFTEQGVSMLSAVIKTHMAVEVSLKIMRAFVEVKRLALNSYKTNERLNNLETKQIETDNKINHLFEAIDEKGVTPKQGIFYDGQVFDAYVFAADLIKSASKSIVLIDNYIDESVLQLFTKRNKNVHVTIFTKKITKILEQDLEKHNSQYPQIEIKKFANAHDRFLIIDEKEIYHIGASLKDLGKKWFAFSRFEAGAIEMLAKLEEL